MEGEKKIFALFTLEGNPLTLDPVTDTFTETTFDKLKLWDIQEYDDPEIWFMGNSPRPKNGCRIWALTDEEKMFLPLQLGTDPHAGSSSRWISKFRRISLARK